MKAWIVMLTGLLVLTGCSCMKPGSPSADGAMFLRADLQDGSRIVGMERRSTLPLRTTSGTLDVPMAQIRRITGPTVTGMVTVLMANNDTVSGTLCVSDLQMATVCGTVRIPLAAVTRLVVFQDATKDLLLRFTFDNDEGENVCNAAGTDIGGVVLRGERQDVAGKKGRGFRAGKGISYILVPPMPQWSFGTNDFSIALWVSLDDVPMNGEHMIVACDDGGGERNKWGLELFQGTLDFLIDTTEGRLSRIAAYPWRYAPGVWYHLAVTRHGDEYRLYVNGECVKTDVNSTPVPSISAPLTIGQGEDLFINGILDDVRIYQCALTPEQVAGLAR